MVKLVKSLYSLNAGVPAFSGSWGAADTPALVGNLLSSPTGCVCGAEAEQRRRRRSASLICSCSPRSTPTGPAPAFALKHSQRLAPHCGWSLLSSKDVNAVLPPPE